MTDQIEQQQVEQKPDDTGWEWMFVEIMGHRSHWGRTREEQRFGAKMLRIDVPVKGDPERHGWATHYYGGAAIFSFALTDEAAVMANNKPYEPAARYRLPAPTTIDDDDGFSYPEEPSENPDREAAK